MATYLSASPKGRRMPPIRSDSKLKHEKKNERSDSDKDEMNLLRESFSIVKAAHKKQFPHSKDDEKEKPDDRQQNGNFNRNGRGRGRGSGRPADLNEYRPVEGKKYNSHSDQYRSNNYDRGKSRNGRGYGRSVDLNDRRGNDYRLVEGKKYNSHSDQYRSNNYDRGKSRNGRGYGRPVDLNDRSGNDYRPVEGNKYNRHSDQYRSNKYDRDMGPDKSKERFYQADGQRCQSKGIHIGDTYSKKKHTFAFAQWEKKELDLKESRATISNKVEVERTPMDARALRKLAENDDYLDVLQEAVSPDSGFQQLLRQENIEKDEFPYVLVVLGKSCFNSTQKRSFVKLLLIVVSNKCFQYLVLTYLVSLNETASEFKMQAFYWLLKYLIAFQETMPANSDEFMSVLLPSIKDCIKRLSSRKELEELEILDAVVVLEEDHVRITRACQDSQVKTDRIFEEKKHALDPIENFRSISIFPTKEDLFKDEIPFLRPNLTYGKYLDIEHYLDVQFRLLREDFIRPLREGIAKVKCLNNNFQTTISEFHIFRDVHILYPRCTPYGVMHTVQFNVQNFRNVNWEAKKRWLMSGSLLCLSKDNFETMLFAEVNMRDLERLKEGLLDIRFDEISDSLLRYRPFDTFVMLETNAYFEAYRHNLRKLQSLNERTMPFQNYIINVNSDVKPPAYLTDNPEVRYDLRPLMIKFPTKAQSELVLKDKGVESFVYDYGDFPEKFDHGKEVDALDSSSWPTRYDLSMEDQQYNAVKNALTREFVIIQGPPGTGKTYIGLRIIQTLLENRHAWHKCDPAPILIVCYTNHALDQFLEDVLLITHKLVRVGGRCFCEELVDYKLRNLRLERREKKMSIVSGCAIRSIVCQLDLIKAKVDEVEKSIAMACEEIISESDLQPHMEHHLWKSLKSNSPFVQNMKKDSDDENCIDYWLAVRVKGKKAIHWLHQQNELQEYFHEAGQKESLGGADEYDEFEDEKDEVEEAKKSKEEEKKKAKEAIFAQDDAEDFLLSRHVDEDDKEFYSKETENSKNGDVRPAPTAENTGYEHVLGGMATRQKYIEKELEKIVLLSPDEISNLPSDIWSLSLTTRWCLYRTWVARFVFGQMEKMVELVKEYQNTVKLFEKLREEEDLEILRSALVVGMTTTGAAKYQNLVSALGPKIVIAEEAAEVLEAHIVTSLCQTTQHLILIGDHQQLRPNPAVYELALKYKLNISLFERLVQNNFPCERLQLQYRMRPTICKLLVPHIYEKLTCHPSVKNRGAVNGVEKSVYFVTHDKYEGKEADSTSLVNEHEAHFLIALCRHLLFQNYKPSEITILATYAMQTNLLQKLAKEQSRENLPLNEVSITPVDSYQGNQNEIILISFVRSNDDGKIGFLSTENRVCVALSRAKKGLYCIGNFSFLAENSNLWTNIVKYLSDKDLIGPELKVVCQNHPMEYAYVRSAEDFRKVPEGGCIRSCAYTYTPCKHPCKLMCHPYDKEHTTLLCTEKCNKKLKKCPQSHRCQNVCGECTLDGSCAMCRTKISVKLPCFHDVRIPCSANPAKYQCPMPCLRTMACGHTCKGKCGEPCDVVCEEVIAIPAPCCHLVKIKCCLKNETKRLLKICNEKCGKKLSCGHICRGTCGNCFQGRFHKLCLEPCKRQLICGHFCKRKCYISCPPCQMQCESQCDHQIKCKLLCSYPCKKCKYSCSFGCVHKKCSLPCWKNCNSRPCGEPCTKIAKCNHTCSGYCGDPCPPTCYTCHFPKNTSQNPRVVLLEQCGHVVKEEELIKVLNCVKGTALSPPCCPQCRTPIKSSRRFSTILKSYNFCLEEAKMQIMSLCDGRKKRQEAVMVLARKMMAETEHCVQLCVERVNHLLLLGDQGVNTLTMLRNVLSLLELVNECCQVFTSLKSTLKEEMVGTLSLYSRASRIQNEILEFVTRMLRQKHIGLEQMANVSNEVLRLFLLCTLYEELSLKGDWQSSNMAPDIKDALQVLSRYLPFTKENIINVIEPLFAKLQKSSGLPASEMCNKVFSRISKPVNMSVEHWFKCERGHVYSDSLRLFTFSNECPDCLYPQL